MPYDVPRDLEMRMQYVNVTFANVTMGPFLLTPLRNRLINMDTENKAVAQQRYTIGGRLGVGSIST
jgi:hypothetical protein